VLDLRRLRVADIFDKAGEVFGVRENGIRRGVALV